MHALSSGVQQLNITLIVSQFIPMLAVYGGYILTLSSYSQNSTKEPSHEYDE